VNDIRAAYEKHGPAPWRFLPGERSVIAGWSRLEAIYWAEHSNHLSRALESFGLYTIKRPQGTEAAKEGTTFFRLHDIKAAADKRPSAKVEAEA